MPGVLLAADARQAPAANTVIARLNDTPSAPAQPTPSQVQTPSLPTTTAPPLPQTTQKKEKSQYEVALKTAPPKDFHLFNQPQTTLVDVFYGGRFVTSVMATYTPATIEFKNPGAVLDKIPNILSIAKVTLENHLTGPLPTHGEQVCIHSISKECGSLEPEFIGVIFDESTFRVDVFIHPDMLASPPASSAQHIPDPTSNNLSLVQNLNAVYTDSNQRSDTVSLYGRTRIGKGVQHFFTDWSSTDINDFSVEQMGYQYDFLNHTVIAGLFEPRANALQAMAMMPIQGISLSTSFKRRTDYDQIIATEVNIFLASYSLVRVYKDGRLYINREYDAGHHRLDTSRLPVGIYNIEIHITEASGNTRVLNKFFIKNGLLAPVDEPSWFIDAGRVVRRNRAEHFPDDGGALLLRGGGQYRYSRNFSLSVAGAIEDKDMLSEVGGVWVNPDYLVAGEIFASTDGAAGWALRGSRKYDKTTFSAATRFQWADLPNTPTSEYRLVSDEVRYYNLNVAHELPDRSLITTNVTETRRNDSDPVRIQALRYSKSHQVSNQDRINLSAELTRTNGDLRGSVAVSWSTHNKHWRHAITPSLQSSEVSGEFDGWGLMTRSTWYDRHLLPRDLQVTGGTNLDKTQETVSLGVIDRSQYGELNGSLSHFHSERASNRLTSLSAETNVVATEGHLHWGGADLNQAGVIIDLKGAEGALFDIYVNNRHAFSMPGNHKATVTLAPYQTHQIQIRDKGTSLVRYDYNPREVTLYPGNTVYLDWKMERVLILVGRLVLEEASCTVEAGCKTRRAPLGDVILEGTRGITTVDPDGLRAYCSRMVIQ